MLVTLVARIGHQVPWSYIEIYIYGVVRCLMWVLETELEQQVLLTTKPRALVFNLCFCSFISQDHCNRLLSLVDYLRRAKH